MIEDCEVVVVGGGPAGSSAALVLGRCRRKVTVFDSGVYRNARSRAVHGYLTRDGESPAELRRLSRAELARYDSVSVRSETVAEIAASDPDAFIVRTSQGTQIRCRMLLLATGLIDRLPSVPGAADLLGDRIFVCPYCDGWELRDEPLAVYDRQGRYAALIAQWSRDTIVCTDGPPEIEPDLQRRLAELELRVESRLIAGFEAKEQGVSIVFREGPAIHRRAIFVNGECPPQSDFARKLGCRLDDKGGVEVGRDGSTSVSGVYVAGDASRDALQAIVAAGEGAVAAVAINEALSR
jgi:thioredoxin reductase